MWLAWNSTQAGQNNNTNMQVEIKQNVADIVTEHVCKLKQIKYAATACFWHVKSPRGNYDTANIARRDSSARHQLTNANEKGTRFHDVPK